MACRVGKGPSRRTGLLARTVMRLCPRCPTSSFDRVGKVARGRCTMSSAAAGAFAHPTMLHTIYAEQDDRQVGRTTMLASRRHVLTGTASLALTAAAGSAFARRGPGRKVGARIKGGEGRDPSQQLPG